MRLRNRRGATLVELMVAAAILSVGVLGLIGGFAGFQKSLQLSKNKTLASNLAQEKMQILKQKAYYQVLVTTAPAYRTDYSPTITYDPGYFSPEPILEGGVLYERLTYVQVCQEVSGVIVTLPPTSDTGMKLITINVLWTEGNTKKKLEIKSILSNMDTVATNAIISGHVRDATTLAAINGALINVAENTGWRDTTDSSGDYTFNLSPGSFYMVASAPGYFTQFRQVARAANQSEPDEDFDLVPVASGTIMGEAWVNDRLLLSQVVVQTNTWVAGDTFKNVEYFELFNPTPDAIDIGTTGDPKIRIDYDAEAAGLDHPHADFNFVFIATYVPSGKYYLIANATSFMVMGSVVNADACYGSAVNCDTSPTYSDYLDNNRAGDIRLRRYSDNTLYDIVGWKDAEAGSDMPDFYEGNPIANAGGRDGIEPGNQIVRASSPSYTSDTYGKAYDSDNNDLDWTNVSGISYPPRNTSSAAQTLIAGRAASGAVVSATDGLSAPVTATLTGSPPRASFSLTQVATGTWTVYLASGSYSLELSTITIPSSGYAYAFLSSTTILNEANDTGYIVGTVKDDAGNPITPAILVESSGGWTYASTLTGAYLLPLSTGLTNLTANPNSLNSSYISQSSNSIMVNAGEVHSGASFILSQGGRVTGRVTRDGINGLPGIAVVVYSASGISLDQQVTDSQGYFLTINIATGTHTVSPVLSSLEQSTPEEDPVTVAIGATVVSDTFTITGALGSISGSVTSGGKAISTGVLIVVTTSTLLGTPPALPALGSSTLTSAPYYVASSYEDGTYQIDVRQSTTTAYRVYAYYTTISPAGAITFGTCASPSACTYTGVTVGAGQSVMEKDFAW